MRWCVVSAQLLRSCWAVGTHCKVHRGAQDFHQHVTRADIACRHAPRGLALYVCLHVS